MSLISKNANTTRFRELAIFIIEVFSALNIVYQIPRLFGAEQERGENDRVKGYVVLAHKLIVLDFCVFLLEPPFSPVIGISG